MDVIRLTKVVNVVITEKQDAIKKGQYALELQLDQTMLLLVFNDVYNMRAWEQALKSAIKLTKWLQSLISFLKSNNEKITQQLSNKLHESLQFIESYDIFEKAKEIEYFEPKVTNSVRDEALKSSKKSEEAKKSGSDHDSVTSSFSIA